MFGWGKKQQQRDMTAPENLLPIGSVVKLDTLDTPIIICGWIVTAEQLKTDYDYAGARYPEGFIGLDETIMFYHDDITEILFHGYESDLRKSLVERLKTIYDYENKRYMNKKI